MIPRDIHQTSFWFLDSQWGGKDMNAETERMIEKWMIVFSWTCVLFGFWALIRVFFI